MCCKDSIISIYRRKGFKLRLFLFFVFLLVRGGSYAIPLKDLSDSLFAYSQRFANIEPVQVKNIRQNGLNIAVYTNPSLSQLSLSPDELLLLKRQVSMWVRGDSKGKVSIYSDKHELAELITSRYKQRTDRNKMSVQTSYPLTRNLSRSYEADKGLEGRHIALWASHGLYYKQDEMRWQWQRAKLWTTVEDLFTSGFTMPFLVPMLENAGAVVLQPRERDTQTEESIAEAEKGRFVPQIKKAGNYAVYVRYNYHGNNTKQAVYTITHAGQKTTYMVNQQMSAGVWVYLDKFYFTTNPARNFITLAAEGKDGAAADALEVRLGGGMGSVARCPYAEDTTEQARLAEYSAVSGYPRFMEGARYFLEYSGYPDSVYSYSEGKNDYIDDLAARGRWVNYLLGGSTLLPDRQGLRVPLSMSIALHSDAGFTLDSTTIGTLAIYSEKNDSKRTNYRSGATRLINRDLADRVQTQVVEDIRKTFSSDWSRRGLKNASYSEARLPEVPSVLVEMLSHQNLADMQLALNPEFKFVVSRAIYKGILRFLHEQSGTPYVVQPLPVRSFAIERAGGDNIRLMWQQTTDTLEPTAKPDYYILFTRREGEDWDNGVKINSKDLIVRKTVKADYNTRYDFRVAAGNAGGISLMSETLSACIIKNSPYNALIINGFSRVAAPETVNRDTLTGGIVPGSYAIPYGEDVTFIGNQSDYDRRHEWVNDDECGFGMSYSDYAGVVTVGNTFDYPSRYADVLRRAGISCVSASEQAVGGMSESKYDLLVLIKGKQKGDSAYFSAPLRSFISRHLQDGGKMLMSGAYIASGLQTKEDRRFAADTLHYRLYSTKATHTGRFCLQPPFLPMTEYAFATTPNDSVICCEAPDGIAPTALSERLARYSDTGVCAGVVYKNQVVVLPFVLEAVSGFDELTERCLRYFSIIPPPTR